ncbi:PERQ amino acid-rich with GYF domain-containing protein 2 [Fopius arisanus]|uniref:PERQ amino acid-rich with GYF domain-containing protein 2 n=2 Tax=Fopius arisanus TaxID=64838 RepID=A0A9R1TCB5_9HYME|nr:PREDICTED: PERQ amino acid-rich with GYF domain-containing protein 2 [Fopius arisanus]XP_011306454.1 PREDICTED: PERQ amino acid-rich with GYF domain-containing protein 2 [Fopius arisanus]
MTDSMKFGPEWLRNLSGDSCNSGGGGGGTANLITPRYQLAEHRYGREEMLALFDRNCKPPEGLLSLQTIYVEKTLLPLAFIPMTEDETRVWSGGVSSAGGRGRGGSVDRGGRGRLGRGGMYSFSRGPGGFDDSGEGSRLDSQPYQGRRVYDRSQSERGWSERNGVADTGEWNGSTSPRKEMSRGASGSSLMESNWRRPRAAGDEEEGWRVASNNRNEKWIRGNWRDGGGERERMDRGDTDGDDGRGGGRWETRTSHRLSHDSHHHPPRTARTWESNHHDNHDNLPEWATENPSESGGSFDASGAFHGGIFSDEDEEGMTGEGRHRRTSEGNNNTKAGAKLTYGHNVIRQSNSTSTVTRERPKSLHPFDGKETPANQERRSASPTKPATTSSALNTNPVVIEAGRKVQTSASSANLVKTEINKIQGPQRSKSFIERTSKPPQNDSRPQEPPAMTTNKSKPPSIPTIEHNPVPPMPAPKPDDDLDRMNAEADMLVAKLTADEESHREDLSSIPPVTNHQPLTAGAQEKWFYRDPQGEVQGPFLANEMAEWCRAGYFTSGLLVRRTCDERYATLGDLMTMCGRVPFIPGHPIPPLKLAEQPVIPPPITNPVPTGLPGSALPKPGIDDPLLMYQHLRLLQNQQVLLRQMKSSAFTKLSQSEHFGTLSAVEQNQLIMQCVMQDPEIRELSINQSPFVNPLGSTTSNPVMQLFNQMQQAKTQSDNHMPSTAHPPIDPIQQFIQKIGTGQNLPPPQSTITPTINPPPAQPSQEDNPIKSLLRQLQVSANGHPQAHPIDSIWPQPPPQINPQFNAQNWLAQVGQLPPMPPGQMPNSLWDLHTKEMKTEQQILEEQNIKIQEDRKKEELRRQEEILRQVEDETVKRKFEAEVRVRQLEEAKRKDEEKRRREDEKRRKEEEKRKQEEELKKREEKKRKDEEKKREEKRKIDEENNRKKQEEEKKKREEAKRQEEKVKKEEDRRRKLEEEQVKRQEEERLKREEENRKRVELEEQARRADQRRREVEALKKLQERSKAPWARAQHAPPVANHASLAEIQRLEREKKAEEMRIQQQMQQQIAQQKAVEAAKEAAVLDSSKRLQFKWAEKAAPTTKQPQVKSLAQIQQEEQERIAKVKQQEKERQEKANQKETAVVTQNAGIWGTASQSLNWAPANSGIDYKGGKNWSGSGFWDEPVPSKPATVVKPQPVAKVNQQTAPKSNVSGPPQQNNKVAKGKVKKEEEIVKKLFENNTAKTDDFQQWCFRALCGLQPSVDIPTFIGFLKDIESAYEVKEYVRMYLGDSKQTTEFTKQFLEKRSKLRSAQRPRAEADDLCKPAPAVNPNAPMEFQEVKGKAKKPKKGKMCKVDSRILGFSVTAATDRINVGDRDYGEGV